VQWNNLRVIKLNDEKLLEDWQVLTECAKCGDKIYSKYQGHFVSCKCGAISVDQTKYYARYLGERKDFIDFDKLVGNNLID